MNLKAFHKTTFARYLTLLVLALMSASNVWGESKTLTETFESATTGTNYKSTQTISKDKSSCGISWSIYYGAPSTTKAITGSNSCLIRYYTGDKKLGYAQTTEGVKGLKSIAFNAKVTNTGNKMGVWYSTDQSNWNELAKDVEFKNTTNVQKFSYNIPSSDVSTKYYIKIGISTGSNTDKSDLTIDDVVFTYDDGEASKTLTSIAISGEPTKKEYEAGEEFDPTGLTVKGTYDDESTAEITSGITWNVTPKPLTVGTTSVSVTATVGEITSEAYQVNGLTVNAAPVEIKDCANIIDGATYYIKAISSETNYYLQFADEISTTQAGTAITALKDAVALTFKKVSDGVYNIITPNGYYIAPATTNGRINVSNTPISVTASNASDKISLSITSETDTWSIQKNNSGTQFGGYRTSQTKITLILKSLPKTVSSIAVKAAPTKTQYYVGDNFDPTGLVITATYDDESTADIAYADNEDKFAFSPALDVALTTANTNVTITYEGKSVEQNIKVSKIATSLAWSKESFEATLGETNVYPTLTTTPTDLQGVTYSSSNPEFATINESGAITLVAEGETTIKASFAETDKYLATDATYILTVKQSTDTRAFVNITEVSADKTTLVVGGETAQLTISNNQQDWTPSYIYESSDEDVATVDESGVVTAVGKGTATITVSVNIASDDANYRPGDTPSKSIEITVNNPSHTAKFSVNGAIDDSQNFLAEEGDAITFPTEVSAPDDEHTFCGWITESISGTQQDAPAYVNVDEATMGKEDVIYYAVFASVNEDHKTYTNNYDFSSSIDKNNWTTSNIEQYFSKPVGMKKANAYIMDKDIPDFANYASSASKISIGVTSFQNSGEGSILTVYLVDKDGKIIGEGKNISPVKGSGASSATKKTVEFDATNGATGYMIKCTTYVKGILITATDYSIENCNVTYSNYCTSVVAKEFTGIELGGEYPTEFWKGDVFNHDGITVTAHYSNADDEDVTDNAEFSTPDMSTAGEQTITVTYKEKTATYTINVKSIANTQETAYSVSEAKAIIDANPSELNTVEVYVKGTVSQVDSYNTNNKSITYWISEDGTTTDQFEVYSGKGIGGTDFDSKDDITIGSDVIVNGFLSKYYSTYEFSNNNQLVKITKQATLSINDIIVENGKVITPEITANVEDYVISYSSNNEDVVLADGDEMVTMGVGTATITATLTADGYKEVTTTFEVEVIPTLASIEVATAPTTVNYKEGEFFNPEGLELTLNYEGQDPDKIKYTSENADQFTFAPELDTPLTIDNTSVKISYAGKETYQGIDVRALYQYDITWMANGVQFDKTQVIEGNTVEMPEGTPDAQCGLVFRGWASNEITEPTDLEPSFEDGTTVPTNAMTFYAVYAKSTVEGEDKLTKMGSDDTFAEGDNIVIVANGTTTDDVVWSKALYLETVSTSYVNFYDFDGIATNVKKDERNYVNLTSNTTDGTWKLGNAKYGYLYNKSDNNLTADKNNSSNWTIAWDGTKSKYSIKSSDRWLSCRSDMTGDNQFKFRGGGTQKTSGTVYFDIYKLSLSTTTYSGYTTAPVNPTVYVTEVSLDITEVPELMVGKSVTLVATVLPENAENKNVSWSSSDEDVAKVENGVVTAVAEGEATITVTTEDGGKTAVCAVNVIPFQASWDDIVASTITLSADDGTSASDAIVVVGEKSYPAIKAGTNKVAGAVVVTVPAGTSKMHVHLGGWNSEDVTVTVTNSVNSKEQVCDLKKDNGIKDNSPFTLDNVPSDNCYEIDLTPENSVKSNGLRKTAEGGDITVTFTATKGNRFVLYGASADVYSREVTIPEDEEFAYGTICLPSYGAVSGNVQFFTIHHKSDVNVTVEDYSTPSYITLEEVEADDLVNGTPYIFKATEKFSVTLPNENIALEPVNTQEKGLVGTFDGIEVLEKGNHIIYSNLLYVVNTDNVEVSPFRAYIDLTNVPTESQVSSPTPGVKMFNFFNNEADGIININGFNVNDNVNVNLNGQPVGAGYKGIVIMNGKKVLRK